MSDAVSNQVRPQRHNERGTARSWPEKSNVSGFIIKREERTEDTGWKLLNVRSLHEDKMFSFSYRNLGPKHYTDCVEYAEKK